MATGERSPQGEGGANYEPFELQPSVLEAVASLCPEHEAEEIWRIVGPSLVEQARDLLDEVRSLPVPPTANGGRITRFSLCTVCINWIICCSSFAGKDSPGDLAGSE